MRGRNWDKTRIKNLCRVRGSERIVEVLAKARKKLIFSANCAEAHFTLTLHSGMVRTHVRPS